MNLQNEYKINESIGKSITTLVQSDQIALKYGNAYNQSQSVEQLLILIRLLTQIGEFYLRHDRLNDAEMCCQEMASIHPMSYLYIYLVIGLIVFLLLKWIKDLYFHFRFREVAFLSTKKSTHKQNYAIRMRWASIRIMCKVFSKSRSPYVNWKTFIWPKKWFVTQSPWTARCPNRGTFLRAFSIFKKTIDRLSNVTRRAYNWRQQILFFHLVRLLEFWPRLDFIQVP